MEYLMQWPYGPDKPTVKVQSWYDPAETGRGHRDIGTEHPDGKVFVRATLGDPYGYSDQDSEWLYLPRKRSIRGVVCIEHDHWKILPAWAVQKHSRFDWRPSHQWTHLQSPAGASTDRDKRSAFDVLLSNMSTDGIGDVIDVTTDAIRERREDRLRRAQEDADKAQTVVDDMTVGLTTRIAVDVLTATDIGNAERAVKS